MDCSDPVHECFIPSSKKPSMKSAKRLQQELQAGHRFLQHSEIVTLKNVRALLSVLNLHCRRSRHISCSLHSLLSFDKSSASSTALLQPASDIFRRTRFLGCPHTHSGLCPRGTRQPRLSAKKNPRGECGEASLITKRGLRVLPCLLSFWKKLLPGCCPHQKHLAESTPSENADGSFHRSQ